MSQKSKCQIKCLNCKKWFSSPIQFEDYTSFFTSYLMDYTIQCPYCRQMTIIDKENIFFDMEMVRKDKEEKMKREKEGFLKRALVNMLTLPIRVLVTVLVWVWEYVPEKFRELFLAEIINVIFLVIYWFHGNYYGVYYSSNWGLTIPFILPLMAYLLSSIEYRVHQDLKGKIEFCRVLLWPLWLGTLMGLYGSEALYT